MTLVLKPGYSFDSDASTYIDAVETADGQALETGVRIAINDFVLGCKQDGIWTAIKASCILAGARTLDGALVPLAGTAPTKIGTEGGWNYNRETGLQGNGTDNSLNSNRNNNADPQDSKHISTYASSWGTASAGFIGSNATLPGDTQLYANNGTGTKFIRVNNASFYSTSEVTTSPFMGASRNSSSEFTFRLNATSNSVSRLSDIPSNRTIRVFQHLAITDARLAFYSIGEALDLAALDTRVSNLITAIGAAIP